MSEISDIKYIATKEFSFGFHGKRFKAGDEVPAEFVSDRLTKLKIIKKVTVENTTQEQVQDTNLEAVADLPLSEIDDTLELLTEQPEDSDVTVEVCETTHPEPDWEWINSLKSTRVDKNLFDDYAAEKFGIKLNANRKLADMISDFKDSL